MLIEDGPHGPLVRTLVAGSFPRAVLDMQHAHDFFQQTVFLDHQLHLLAHAEPRPLARLPAEDVARLVGLCNSVDATFSQGSRLPHEGFYFSVVAAHLRFLSDEPVGAAAAPDDSAFSAYLKARFAALGGLGAWLAYLEAMPRYGAKLHVAQNAWVDCIAQRVLQLLSAGGTRPLRFSDVAAQRFGDNACALVTVCNYALRSECEPFVLGDFRADYSRFLQELLGNKIKQKSVFPDAAATALQEEDFVESLYETLNNVTTNRARLALVLRPRLLKQFLLNMTEKTYQSRAVLAHLVRTLVDLDEYDEALAAFETYVEYLGEEQAHGHTRNLVEAVDLYAGCVHHFNPLRLCIAAQRFAHTTLAALEERLAVFAAQLGAYLQQLTHTAQLSFDTEIAAYASDPLLFLYHRYNTNVHVERLPFGRTVARAFFALGELHHYLATHRLLTLHDTLTHQTQVLAHYKSALVVNATGNALYLFSYALALAHLQQTAAAVKLCKFVLKRFPELFKTWNLLVLLVLAQENEALAADTAEASGDVLEQHGLERLVEDALGVAGVFAARCRQNNVAVLTLIKHDILQLKLTQLAVSEAKHGVEHVLEALAEVFALYRELFDVEAQSDPRTAAFESLTAPLIADGRWLHRPSVIDPAEGVDFTKKKNKILRLLKLANANVRQSYRAVSGRSHKSDKEEPKRETLKEKVPIKDNAPPKDKAPAKSSDKRLNGNSVRKKEKSTAESRILQDLWLWAAAIYMKVNLSEEAEQCIVEAELVDKPSVLTYTFLGLLTSKSRKFLALQEFERSLEVFHSSDARYNRRAYGVTLLGMCKLFISDDDENNSLFISSRDRDAGWIRLKNYLEEHSHCWPYGRNCPEVWYYLAAIYEKIDDKMLYNDALWRCVELDRVRPVRPYDVCEPDQIA